MTISISLPTLQNLILLKRSIIHRQPVVLGQAFALEVRGLQLARVAEHGVLQSQVGLAGGDANLARKNHLPLQLLRPFVSPLICIQSSLDVST